MKPLRGLIMLYRSSWLLPAGCSVSHPCIKLVCSLLKGTGVKLQGGLHGCRQELVPPLASAFGPDSELGWWMCGRAQGAGGIRGEQGGPSAAAAGHAGLWG